MKKYQFSNKTKALEAIKKRWENHHPFFHFKIDSGKVFFTYRGKDYQFSNLDEAFIGIKELLKL